MHLEWLRSGKNSVSGCVFTPQAWWVFHSEHVFSVTYTHAWAAGSDGGGGGRVSRWLKETTNA